MLTQIPQPKLPIPQTAVVVPIVPALPNQPVFSYYRPEVNRYIDANDLGRMAQTDGATRIRTDPIPPVSQPELRNYENRKQMNRYIVDVTKRLEGATVMRTDPVPPVTTGPHWKYYLPDQNNRWDQNDLGRMVQNDGAIRIRTDPVPPVSQPEVTRYERQRQTLRYIVDAPRRIDGSTVLRTDPIPPIKQPEPWQFDRVRQALRYIVEPVKRFEGSTVMQIHPTPPVTGPQFAYYFRPNPNRIGGVTVRLEGPVPAQARPRNFAYFIQ